MRGASRWLYRGVLLLVAAGCSHDSRATRSWEETGVRTKGGDSATFRIQVLIADGQLQQAEAMLVQTLAAGLLTQASAERLRERLSEQKERQGSDPKRPLPPIVSEDPSTDDPSGERRTCWTELPDHPVCQQLPEEYTFHSARQALEAMKQRLGAKNLVLHNPDSPRSGPCEELGEHFNVRMNGQRAGSITCCPCCVESANGPLTWTKCRIVW
jgi:hypothetical protein